MIGRRIAACAIAACIVALPAAPAAAANPVLLFVAADTAEQTLAMLDTQIQTAAMLAHFMWQTSRFASFADHFAVLVPDSAKVVNGAAARYRSDIEVYLDLYSALVLQMASGPARLNVPERIDRVDQDMSDQGLVQFKRFLPILQQHIEKLQEGAPPSRVQMRADILAVPSATEQHHE